MVCDVGPKGEKFACRPTMQPSERGRCVLSPLRICIEEIKPSSVLLAVASSAMNKPEEIALRLSDCTEICVIVV